MSDPHQLELQPDAEAEGVGQPLPDRGPVAGATQPTGPDPRGAAGTVSEPATPAGPLIDRLASAVVSTARGLNGRWFFVGWTAEGLPAASISVEDLSDSARRDLASFRGARLEPRKVPFATLIPVSYAMTGSAIDFSDTPDRRAEDQVGFAVVDAAGARRDLALGELALLGAIGAAREPWQSHQVATGSGLAVDAVPLYTLFTTLPGVRADTGLAMLFESTLAGGSNEPAFRSCLRNVIGRLLVLDESQAPERRKGYLQAAGRLAGVPPDSGMLGSLVWLRKAGLITFEDSWLQSMQGRGRRIKGGLIRALRGAGMVEVSDEMLAEISDTRPDYDVDRLDLRRMLDLAAAMHGVAREALDPSPPSAPTGRRGRRGGRR
ncbi:MAG: hypothetical protein H6648_03740 [Caldilineae bacterium]|nr:hypothetical protein [Chloroflexota bacterium]MCB9176247.1 hypothetical protein [Caldilineae bacterium]